MSNVSSGENAGLPGRPSRQVWEQNKQYVRAALRVFARPDEIQKKLGVSKTSYYRIVKAISKENDRWLREMASKTYADMYRNIIEVEENQIRDLESAKRDAMNAKNTREVVNCALAIHTVATEIIALLTEGPAVWSLKRRGQALQTQQVEQKV